MSRADQVESRRTPHEERVRFLHTLAIMLGCRRGIGGQLPDGRRPDVVRLDIEHGVLFLGEAKDTETHGNLETRSRLRAYLWWLQGHLASGRPAIFGLCIPAQSHIQEWHRTFLELGTEFCLTPKDMGYTEFPGGFGLLWFTFKGVIPIAGYFKVS